MTYELFQEDPIVFFCGALVNLIFTLIIYGLFPLLFAKCRQKPITEKKYKWICYLVNGFFCICQISNFNEEALNLVPFLLWTTVFVKQGKKILFSKNIIDGYIPKMAKENLKTSDSKLSDYSDYNSILDVSIQNIKENETCSVLKNENANTNVESKSFESVQICKVQSSDGTKQWNTYWPDEAYQTVCAELQKTKEECDSLKSSVTAEKQKTLHHIELYDTLHKEHSLVKRKAKGRKIHSFILIVLLLAVSIGSAFLLYNQNETISSLHLENSALEARIDDYRAEEDRVNDIKDEYTFYHSRAALVTPEGEKYHRFGCKHISGKSVKVYDTRTALLEGYRACYDCCYN